MHLLNLTGGLLQLTGANEHPESVFVDLERTVFKIQAFRKSVCKTPRANSMFTMLFFVVCLTFLLSLSALHF